MQDALSIGELAGRAGVATSAIRYYEAIGVLPEPYRVSGQRRYGEDALARLRFVAAAQRAGFTLREIADLSGEFDLAALSKSKLREVEEELARARAARRWLKEASGCDCATPEECALFDDDVRLEVIHVDGCRRTAVQTTRR